MNQHGWRRMATACLSAALALMLLGSCTGDADGTATQQPDILTQKPTEAGRTPVTVLVKNAFSIHAFEAAVEEKFPDIDLIQVGNYVRNIGVTEYAARLEHDDLTDIVMTWPLDVGAEYWADRLLDLSGMDFTANYNISMLNTISRDGKLYYLPGPAQVRGIVYNKTLFAENGWEVPKDLDGFIALCKTIEESGIRALQLGFENPEVLDTAFVGYSYGNSFSTPMDSQWIADYDNGRGSFGDHFGPALDTFQRLIDEKIWRPEDLQVDYAERETLLFTRQCAMVEDSVLMARLGGQRTGITDEFALMPFFTAGEEGDWARLYMVCYIGLNKHLAEPENKETYDKALRLMEYISTPEGQLALAADTGAMYSSVMGVPPPNIPEIADLLPALERGRYAIFPELKNAQTALREGLAGLLRGELTREELIRRVDERNNGPVSTNPPQKLATATEDFTLMETGNLVTDALREFSGCEIALFLDNGKDGQTSGKGISARLYQGDVTNVDLLRVLPDLRNNDTGTLWKVSMTGADLLKTLEHAIGVDNNIRGWFYYFSGLKMEYDPMAEPGRRVKNIAMTDGSALDANRTYTVAVMDHSVPQEYLLTCEETDATILDILTQAMEQAGTISPSKDGRFTVAEHK